MISKTNSIKDNVKIILAAMTPLQRRRYRLYIKGNTQAEIARAEGVSQQAVQKCLDNAKKRIKKRLKRVVK